MQTSTLKHSRCTHRKCVQHEASGLVTGVTFLLAKTRRTPLVSLAQTFNAMLGYMIVKVARCRPSFCLVCI